MSFNPFEVMRYWTWEGAQQFLLDNDLAISSGLEDDDEVVLTGRGQELLITLIAVHALGGGVPQ